MWFFYHFLQCKFNGAKRFDDRIRHFFYYNIISIIQHLCFAVQLTIYPWDTLSCNNPLWLLLVNLILIQWAVAYQAVMWLMESLHQEIFIPFGWIQEMSENFSILTLLLLNCLLNEQQLSLSRLFFIFNATYLDMWTGFICLTMCMQMYVLWINSHF